MVSALAPKFGFNIDSLLGGGSKMSAIGAEFLSASDSAFTNVKSSTTKDANRQELLAVDRDCLPTLQPPVTMSTAGHQHKDSSDFCLQCLDSSTINLQDTLISSVRPYDTTDQHLLNRNNINNKTLYRNNTYQTNSWSIFDSSTPTPAVQSYELSQHSNIGNFGLKLHNNLVQLDNISNISSVSNIQNISNTYSPFSSLYPGLSTGQFGSQVGPPRVDHAVTGPAFTWGTPRGMGFLTPRCSDSGLFMPSYRKPKRVRTAFSPTQLLRLEHAFEKNHYVVGQERKELSASLNLSETQVKVWFQNRRTKHKRMQTEEELTASLCKRLGDDRISRTPSLEDVIIDQ